MKQGIAIISTARIKQKYAVNNYPIWVTSERSNFTIVKVRPDKAFKLIIFKICFVLRELKLLRVFS